MINVQTTASSGWETLTMLHHVLSLDLRR